MTLVKTKPKPANSLHKKRLGEHHKKTSRYNKTYWPFLPVLLMISGGVILTTRINSNVSALDISSNYSYLTNQNVANVTVLQAIMRSPNTAVFSLVVVMFIAAILLLSFRSYRKLKKFFVQTEEVLLKNYAVDFVLALIIVAGLVLTKQLS